MVACITCIWECVHYVCLLKKDHVWQLNEFLNIGVDPLSKSLNISKIPAYPNRPVPVKFE